LENIKNIFLVLSFSVKANQKELFMEFFSLVKESSGLQKEDLKIKSTKEPNQYTDVQ